MTEDDFMRYAIELGRRKMDEIGAAPFAAVVVKDGEIVQARTRKAFGSLADATEVLGRGFALNERDVDVKSAFFEVRGRLRLEQHALEELTLVERRSGLEVVAIQRLRRAALTVPPR